MAAGPVSKLQGSYCNLYTLNFVETGPGRGLQVSNYNLTTPDFLAAGPVDKLQGSNCNLTTPGFCLGRIRGRPDKDQKVYKLEFQNFAFGRASQPASIVRDNKLSKKKEPLRCDHFRVHTTTDEIQRKTCRQRGIL